MTGKSGVHPSSGDLAVRPSNTGVMGDLLNGLGKMRLALVGPLSTLRFFQRAAFVETGP